MGFEILAFGSHCSANFQPILDCFSLKFKLKYDNLENIKADRVNRVVFNLYQISQSYFRETRYLQNFDTENEKKNRKFLNFCGLSTESFLAIWPSQYKFLRNEFRIRMCVSVLSLFAQI